MLQYEVLELERTISSKILHRGRNFSFLLDEVELPSGRRTTRNMVNHPGAVAIIPVLQNNKIVLVKQYRYSVKNFLLELPAGTIENEESPRECAKRELLEETGCDAGTLERVFACFTAPGYSSELIHFFMARKLRKMGQKPEQDESLFVMEFKLEELLDMIAKEEIRDAKTIIGLLFYNRLKEK
jgi:ADP-ribose pyrophosphatase